MSGSARTDAPNIEVRAGGAGAPAVARHESLTRIAVRRFLRHRLAIVGSVILGVIVLVAALAPVFASADPALIDLRLVRAPPGPGHPLGGDVSGRDAWSRLVYGARTSLIVGFGAVGLYVAIGTVLGVVAGYLGGAADQLIMRFTDTVLSIPTLLLVIVFVSIVGPSLGSVIAVIGLLGWPATCRLVRGQLLTLREAEFITAARVVGVSDRRIVATHLVPNILGQLTVVATFGVASAILLEASLSFLGLGVKPPTSSLGEMINAARSPTILQNFVNLWLPPGLVIALTVLAVNFVGDGLRDALDPRSARDV